tara:strand:- start:1969 stop:3129 length:1161 start_codon:yes stop_codon:yes gene_type:complete
MENVKRYIYLAIGLISIIIITIFLIMPNFQTEEFSQDVIDDIIEGVTTTTLNEQNTNEEVSDDKAGDEEALAEVITIQDEALVISNEEKLEIEIILKNNKPQKDINNFNTYLLIGSDERSGDSIQTRGKVQGKRADVIILGLVDKITKETTLLSFPRDLLILNSCTEKLERLNASFSKNNCGNGPENLAAAIYSISGISVNHFASFDFEGFEEIIDSVGGIEICVDQTQKEGYSFELQKGCQITNGLTTLNWVVSRSTEVLVGEKSLDQFGNDNSEWELMSGVSDLTRIKRQQYVVIQLINKVKNFESINDLNKLIKALESTFVIDENLTISKAAEILWGFREFDLSKVNKITTPVDYLTLRDGRQVLVLNQNLYEYLVKNSIINN